MGDLRKLSLIGIQLISLSIFLTACGVSADRSTKSDSIHDYGLENQATIFGNPGVLVGTALTLNGDTLDENTVAVVGPRDILDCTAEVNESSFAGSLRRELVVGAEIFEVSEAGLAASNLISLLPANVHCRVSHMNAQNQVIGHVESRDIQVENDEVEGGDFGDESVPSGLEDLE